MPEYGECGEFPEFDEYSPLASDCDPRPVAASQATTQPEQSESSSKHSSNSGNSPAGARPASSAPRPSEEPPTAPGGDGDAHTGYRRRRRRRGGQAAQRLESMQWRLADEIVALGEALRVADRPLEVAEALLVLAMRACRELMEATPSGRLRLEQAGATPVERYMDQIACRAAEQQSSRAAERQSGRAAE